MRASGYDKKGSELIALKLESIDFPYEAENMGFFLLLTYSSAYNSSQVLMIQST